MNEYEARAAKEKELRAAIKPKDYVWLRTRHNGLIKTQVDRITPTGIFATKCGRRFYKDGMERCGEMVLFKSQLHHVDCPTVANIQAANIQAIEYQQRVEWFTKFLNDRARAMRILTAEKFEQIKALLGDEFECPDELGVQS